MNKSQIRKKILKIRKKNFDKNFKINSDELITFLKTNISNLKNIGGYYPSNYEIDDLEILDLLEKKDFNASLPRITKNNQMNFYKWSNNDLLKINKFGIPEPLSSRIFYPDVLLIPIVAYDSNFNRLGYGGGFYDRYIQKIEKIKKIIKIGLAFSFQKTSSIPINRYDKRLDFIITEKEILR
ncbi:5-formyltetrahydrofolate cyclo-ligase [Candidatus Pelagibacter bacterium nBUS_27]|uniref:5-formyltetrahydrofolate cyclo-ligase n=1 Tax=Candidatus Pelagibacter bacterium nBUS_27 TaxID=3374188 RepID=UPI003EB9D2EA